MYNLVTTTAKFTRRLHGLKVCTTCRKAKEEDQFYNSKATTDGKSYRCKSCDKDAGRDYRSRNREKYLSSQRARNRKSKYGVSEEEFLEMKQVQGGKCAICGVVLQENATNKHTAETLCIDHCHGTGRVRGLLCTKCNKGLGLFNDDVNLLSKAVTYLNSEIH